MLEEFVLQGLALIAAVLYVAVGVLLLRRPVDKGARSALRGFIVWWFGLAFLALYGIVRSVGFEPATFGLLAARFTIYGLFAVVFAMLAGLVYYLVYLYTGKRGWLRPIIVFYVLQFGYVALLLEWSSPYIAIEEGRNVLRMATPIAPGSAPLLLFSALLLLPPLAAGIAYALLYFQVPDRTSRFRIGLVSGGIILWFGYSVLSTITRAMVGAEAQGFEGRLIGQLFGLLAAVLVLVAYVPPHFLRRRLHIGSVTDEGASGESRPGDEKGGVVH